jgi:zinc transport system substrate-binding protein
MTLFVVSMNDSTSRQIGRRDLLRSVGAVGLGSAVAGCVGSADQSGNDGGSSEGDGPLVVASFFSFYDFAHDVAAGTSITVENLVPVGLHGHGWEPDASITRRIIDADAFLHVGEDFQPWADRAIQTARDDGADTVFINAREGIELIDIVESVGEDEQVGDAKDPHFWLDPQRAKQSVRTITEAFVALAPDEEARLRENAASLAGELDAIDAEYRELFADPPRRVIQLAAHNAFQYVADRYDVEMRPLVYNLAASGDVKPADLRRAKATIEENDIRYIGAAVFESLRPARQLLAETSVEAYFPVTPYAGVREDWVEQGWGYAEIAREINIPTFEVVLGAKTPEEAGHEEWRNFGPGA